MPQRSSWRPGVRGSSLLAAVAAFVLFAFQWRNNPATRAISTVTTARSLRDPGYSSDSMLGSNVSLGRREDYTCSASAPCSNGARCGASGFCGYGSKYCGNGCLSQCDATAECGENASEPGKKCPLNFCCSQYGVEPQMILSRLLGFCGTTQEFCDDKCQSNCVVHPSPPGGGTGQVFDKVIGYYESWSNGKSCHNIRPTDLPLDALTHVNYAFAYIDPGSYQIVTMDSATPGRLFDDLTTLKAIKPDLEVWVSIGGWTFSDNNTATQPVFGEIAADEGKRQKLASNLVHFMQQHGFDGVDLDWEYPGAPDRGGRKEDTANYVQLLKTLKSTFDGSGSKYGLTFTAPSSLWYLRWFDIPNMLKYSDWINFMTYDLHGVWDAENPIGSIVQGHTNLTEIKLATELLWRVEVPPSKVVLGFGFYGRSFTLADASCSTPGCPFSGASKPGPCTATGGYLGFYEIQEVLRSGVKPVHDSEAAVNFLVFDQTQWISYDDSVTFKQKADWANKVGLGGSMIWASDLDDDKYSAHSALLGRKINPTSSLQNIKDLLQKSQRLALTASIKAQTGEGCKTYDGDCQDLNDNKALADACGSGFTVVGWGDAGCGKKNHHYGKPICCPTLGAPTSCTWRGDNTGGVSGDCSSECYEGEINVGGIYSHWGGGFTNDGNTNRCRRGEKAFCCVAPDHAAIKKKCSLTSCSGSCSPGSTPMFKYYDDCWFNRYKTYCCPDPAPVSDCHWVGDGGDCKNVHCPPGRD
ncbi:bacteriodes thetaiotaomicron symbiotic chitinase [Apiospora aurea]|uniref:chitinase n=1 Tax=Apiospora aurea TaxID=335848 RepID=A0ABR1QSC2_9PEZI